MRLNLFFLFVSFAILNAQGMDMHLYDAYAELDTSSMTVFTYIRVEGNETFLVLPSLVANASIENTYIEDEDNTQLSFELVGDLLYVELDQPPIGGKDFFVIQEAAIRQNQLKRIDLDFPFLMDASVVSLEICLSENASIIDFERGGNVYEKEGILCVLYMFSDVVSSTNKSVFVTYRDAEPDRFDPTKKTISNFTPANNSASKGRINDNPGMAAYILFGLILLIVCAMLAFVFLKKRKGENSEQKEVLLPEKEKRLFIALKQEGGRATQAKLKSMTGLSGPSLSRAIKSLENQGVIESSRFGMTNMVVLKEKKNVNE